MVHPVSEGGSWTGPAGGRADVIAARASLAERVACWALIAVAVLIALVVVRDEWRRVGRVGPGFAVMENAQVGVGGYLRGDLPPMGQIVEVNGRPVLRAADILAEVERHPPGTSLRYRVRQDALRFEASVPTQVQTARGFLWFLVDGALPCVLVLGLAALVLLLRPGTPECRLFLAFSLVTATTSIAYADLMSTHRFTRLTLALWSFSPALLLHLAMTFPERRRLVERHPWVTWVPYLAATALAVWLEINFTRFAAPIGEIIAAYAGLSAIALVASLAWTWRRSPAPLARRRARVLLLGFGIGYVVPTLGTSAEIALAVTVPYLHLQWELYSLFPAAVAYAIVRHQLFDVRAAIRVGAIYSAVTGLVALGYVGLLTGVDLVLTRADLTVPPVLASAAVALAVVLLMNPMYGRVRTFVDRLFFRERYDARRALEALGDQMTTVLELDRIEALVTRTADALFHPDDVVLALPADGSQGFRGLSRAGRAVRVPDGGALGAALARVRGPLTRSRLRDDPGLADLRHAAIGEADGLGADAVVPILFRDRAAALLLLGRRKSDADYGGDDLRVLRALANQSAVALENARAYRALEAALRRVQILESIRANLAKFVPRAVQDLIERAPDAPALAKRDADVSVLFIDIVGYSRLSERLDPARLNEVVERYFGAFLDEILAQGGDVNETAGDGLMVIFQDPDARRHAVAAVLAGLGVLRRTAEINAEARPTGEPIAVHIGVNSGVAAVGATRIEGMAGTRWTYTASGPVTNVAARLAALGDGDAVVIGAETERRLGPEFSAEDLGETHLRNIDEPVRVFRLRAMAASLHALEGRA
jgi:class 3 adenylate cyclase